MASSYLLQDPGPTGARRQTAAQPVIPVDEKFYSTARRLAQVADLTTEQLQLLLPEDLPVRPGAPVRAGSAAGPVPG